MARLRTIIVLCALVTIKGVKSETVLVETRYGTVGGIRTPLGGDVYVDSFLQIPYARPPTGNFRFHAPELPEVWNGVRDATEYGPQCVQQDSTDQSFDVTIFRESEDCLFLNVYTPRVPVERGRLPVMVAIHGGGFVVGAGSQLDGTVLAGFGVVVVTINYRLSALGFLSTEDAVSPGNYGILDQIKALEWVRDSIFDFNGNPGNVTIFGESAGSASVSLLIASRAARGLFHRAIMESGVSVALWATGVRNFDPEPRAITLQLADRLGCAMRADSTEIVSCLRTKNAKTIINATTDLQNEAGGQILFRPVVETTFGQDGIFTAIPETIFKNGWFSDVPTIRGYNKNENARGLEAFDPEGDGFTMDEFHQALKILSDNYFRQSRVAVDTARIEELLVNAYITQPNVTDPKLIRDAYAQLSTDYMFLASTLHEIQLAAMTSENPQYLYRFSYRSANRLNPEWQGVIHADELPYVFGYPLVNGVMWGGFVSNWTEEDKRVSQNVMTLWTNFAKYGNPTPDSYEGVTWFPWESDVHRGLEITSSLTPLADPTTPQITLWIETIFPLLRGESDVIIG